MRWCGGILLLCLFLFAGCSEAARLEREPVGERLAFFNGSGVSPERGAALAAQLAVRDVDLVAALSQGGDGKSPFVRWLPGGAETPATLPAPPPDARWGYSFDRGPLHVTVIETDDPMAENSEAFRWLRDDLSLTTRPWKVVLMRRPIFSFDPTRVDRARLDLADLLSGERVSLVLSPGDAGYFRSARIGSSLRESVHYAILGWKEKSASDPDGAARAVGEPCSGVLEVQKALFRWSAFDPQSRLADLLQFSPVPLGSDDSKVFLVSELLAAEQAQKSGGGDEKK